MDFRTQVIFALLTFFYSFNSYGGSAVGSTGTYSIIVDVNPSVNNGIPVAHIRFNNDLAPHNDVPTGCTPGFFVVSLDSDHGRLILETALSAKTAAFRERLAVSGTGVCADTWPESETIKFVAIR